MTSTIRLESSSKANIWRELGLLALALLFGGVGLATLALVERGRVTPADLTPLGVLGAALLVAVLLLRIRRPAHDPYLLPITALLTGWGLVLVARLTPALLPRQTLWAALGVVGMVAVAAGPRDLRWLRRYRYLWLLGGLLLVGLTLVFGVNPSGYGARLWLGGGGLYFQPSELLKLLLVAYLASYLSERRELLRYERSRLGPWRLPPLPYLGPLLLMWGVSLGLMVWQQDLGAALLFLGTFLAMLYAATGHRLYIGLGMVLFVLGAWAAYYLFPRVALRVDIWWSPWAEARGRAFQIVQSLLAFASGGVFGQGVGQGYPTFVPVVHSDFAFAAIGEEWGLAGTLACVSLFALLVERSFHIALRARDDFACLLAAGLGSLLALQSLTIMGGTLKLIPLTGVTLPFVSYGGSSLVTSFLAVGLLLHVSGGPE